MYAAEQGNADAVNCLLSRGANVNAKGHNGETALIFAAQCSHGGSCVQPLLSRGADVNAKTTAY
jgi:ankyrin repeat protein